MSCDNHVMYHHSYGFGLEECRERDLAEEVTKKSLAMEKENAFATHALSEYTYIHKKLRILTIAVIKLSILYMYMFL